MNKLDTRREAVVPPSPDDREVVFSDEEFEISVRECAKAPKVRGVLAE